MQYQAMVQVLFHPNFSPIISHLIKIYIFCHAAFDILYNEEISTFHTKKFNSVFFLRKTDILPHCG